MSPKVSVIVSLICVFLMILSAVIAGSVLAFVAVIGGLCSGMAIMSAAFRWPDQ